jgi:hypothetical protein
MPSNRPLPDGLAPPTIRYVATSYICDRDTRELGEDYAQLKKVERAYRLLERRLSRAAVGLRSRRAVSTVTEFNLLLADARHDASWGATLALAKDASDEARVARFTRSAP